MTSMLSRLREGGVRKIAFLFAICVGGYASSAPATENARQQSSPNVLVWMLDDVGFAQLSSYGGMVETPNIDRIAESGLRYSNFRTTPICSASVTEGS